MRDRPPDGAHAPAAAFQLAALSYRQGAVLGFDHKFYVNATPRAWDIDFANTNTATPPQTGNDWRTILVGGLGAGGRAVYALDVTTPVGPTGTATCRDGPPLSPGSSGCDGTMAASTMSR